MEVKQTVCEPRGKKRTYGNFLEPPIPYPYTYVGGTWNKGFTITDGKNLWTWLPVESLKDGFVRRNWDNDDFGTEKGFHVDYHEADWYVKELDMLEKFGGIYVSAYPISGEDVRHASSSPNCNALTSLKYQNAQECASHLGIAGVSESHILCGEEVDSIDEYLQELISACGSENIEEISGIHGWFGTMTQWTQEKFGEHCQTIRYTDSTKPTISYRTKEYRDESNACLVFRAALIFD